MKLKYVGPFDEVEIPELGVTVVRNGPVEASGETAERLLEQRDNFKKVAAPRKPKATKKAAAKAAPKGEE